jgi:hypothetical protein
MPSIHEEVLKEKVDRLTTDDPNWRLLLSDVLRRMEDGFYSPDYLDAILQNWWLHHYDIYDAYAFAQVHTQILTGRVATALVNVDATPRGDKEVDYHNAVLADSQSHIFFGTFYGGLADQDGSFAWKSHVEFDVHRYDGAADKVRKPRPISIAPRTVPLEVGYTKGSRTMLHLGLEHGLARWPYGSELITVFVAIDPFILKLPYSPRRTGPSRS